MVSSIPQQLILAGARYVLIGKNSKVAIEKEWELNNYDATSSILLNHIKNGGNYGVITRNGICVIDIDTPVEIGKRISQVHECCRADARLPGLARKVDCKPQRVTHHRRTHRFSDTP